MTHRYGLDSVEGASDIPQTPRRSPSAYRRQRGSESHHANDVFAFDAKNRSPDDRGRNTPSYMGQIENLDGTSNMAGTLPTVETMVIPISAAEENIEVVPFLSNPSPLPAKNQALDDSTDLEDLADQILDNTVGDPAQANK